MEVIAGNSQDGWSTVQVREEGCVYVLDFQRVYWNSRLGGEHRRLVKVIREDATATARMSTLSSSSSSSSLIVADMMAGIGPFAIPLTSTTNTSNKSMDVPIIVHANDLNPASYEYLVINSKKNKCQNLHMYNMDARAFCHRLQDEGVHPDHFIMNLPATALEFLDAFRGYRPSSSLSSSSSSSSKLPQIHVHCFAPKNLQDARRDIWKRAEASLGCSLDQEKDQVSIHLVRDVAPNKNMYCVSFRLPEQVQTLPRVHVAAASKANNSDSDNKEPEQKKQKRNEEL
mmetsp:Transcript_9219/g.16754  ORF Transcript_9219/g.16754 Transcript_9219/m.16754 type:complete len:286 (+) Transcript_9219:1328-2185(+)